MAIGRVYKCDKPVISLLYVWQLLELLGVGLNENQLLNFHRSLITDKLVLNIIWKMFVGLGTTTKLFEI